MMPADWRAARPQKFPGFYKIDNVFKRDNTFSKLCKYKK